jgi:hypothetical protein
VRAMNWFDKLFERVFGLVALAGVGTATLLLIVVMLGRCA